MQRANCFLCVLLTLKKLYMCLREIATSLIESSFQNYGKLHKLRDYNCSNPPVPLFLGTLGVRWSEILAHEAQGSISHLGLTPEVNNICEHSAPWHLVWAHAPQPPGQSKAWLIHSVQVSLKATILREAKSPKAHAQLPWRQKVGNWSKKTPR